MMMCSIAILVVALSIGSAARLSAQPSPDTPPPVASASASAGAAGVPAAYYQFILARHLESEGQVDRAIAAYREAARLDPQAADIRAELAGLLARQGRLQAAAAEARAALAMDSQHREANRVLGSILASMIEPREGSRPASDTLEQAIVHLERGRRTDGIDIDPSLDLTLARLYLRASQHAKAVSLLERVVATEPVSEAWLLLAEAHGGTGNLDAAAKALEEGSRANPRLLAALGELYERQQRWDRAASTYERAAALAGQPAELTLRWAGALLNLQDESAARRARTLLETVAAAQPTDGRTLYLLSQAQRRVKDLAAAEATARRVIALEPSSLWGAWALAQVQEDRREYTAVVETLSAALAGWKPGDGSRHGLTMLTRLGFAQLQLGRHDDAIATFERAKAAGGDATYDLYLAQAQLDARRFDQALALLDPLQLKQPADARLAQMRARALAGAGRRDEAVTLLENAVQAHGSEATTYLALADMLSTSSRTAEALGVLDRAAERFPDNLSVPFQRGALHERAKEFDKAEAAFRAVLTRDPQHAPTLNYLGYMLAERGERLDEAVQLIERALALDPANGSYLDSLGWAYFQLRRYDEAQAQLARAAEQLPDNSVVQDHLGDVLAALDRHAEAIAAWQRALAGDREGVDERTIREKLSRSREQAAR